MREMMEIIEAYNDFLRNSGCLDHFTLYKILKKHMAGKHEVLKDIASKVYSLICCALLYSPGQDINGL